MNLIRNSSSAVSLFAVILVALSAAAANPRSGRISVPVMTPLTVKLDNPVSWDAADKGGGFTATISQAVEVDGVAVIPAGASAAGLVHKTPQPSIELNSVFVNGRSYRVTTSPVVMSRKKPLPAGSTVTFSLTLSLSIAR